MVAGCQSAGGVGPTGTGSPTGTVFNGGPGFLVTANGVTSPAAFLFATLDGGIFGWTGYVGSSNAVEITIHPSGPSSRGLLWRPTQRPLKFFFTPDAANGVIDVFDKNFRAVSRRSPGAFQDQTSPLRIHSL